MACTKNSLLMFLTMFVSGWIVSAPASPDASASGPATQTDAVADVQTGDAKPSLNAVAAGLQAKLSKKMPYQEFRRTVLDEGWLPLKTPDCRKNVGGKALICASDPEVESCSGDGYCNRWFAHGSANTKLRVGTYDTRVRFWEFVLPPEQTNTVACPSGKFTRFFKAYAANKSVQQAFTAPLVKVEELYGFDAQQRTVYLQQKDYQDFDLTHKKDGYHFVGPSGTIDSKPLAVDITKEARDTYLVKYSYGISEGNSYRFKKQEKCWYLVEDPEAPSP